MYQLLEEQVSGGERVHMAVINAAALEEAAVVKAEVQARFKPVELLEALVSPALGVHAGPGTVGVAFYVE
jgi:fatty acid-binding protein DegV